MSSSTLKTSVIIRKVKAYLLSNLVQICLLALVGTSKVSFRVVGERDSSVSAAADGHLTYRLVLLSLCEFASPGAEQRQLTNERRFSRSVHPLHHGVGRHDGGDSL